MFSVTGPTGTQLSGAEREVKSQSTTTSSRTQTRMDSAMYTLLLIPMLMMLLPGLLAKDPDQDGQMRPYNLLLIREAEFYILPFMEHTMEEFAPHFGKEAAVSHFDDVFNWYKYEMNRALNEWREADPDNALHQESILHILQHLQEIPNQFADNIRHYGGGYLNHVIYFSTISPNPEGEERRPTGYLLDEINEAYGDFDTFKKSWDWASKRVQSTGYVWLVRIGPNAPRNAGKLYVMHTHGQNSPLFGDMFPLAGIDLWEHSYYMKYKHERWEYIKEFWKVIDWSYVERLDKWWKNIDEEQEKANDRVRMLKEALKQLDALSAMAEEKEGQGQDGEQPEVNWKDDL